MFQMGKQVASPGGNGSSLVQIVTGMSALGRKRRPPQTQFPARSGWGSDANQIYYKPVNQKQMTSQITQALMSVNRGQSWGSPVAETAR